jgi:hypothetical protein
MNAISQALIQLAQAINVPGATIKHEGPKDHPLPPEELAMADAFAEFLTKERAKCEESGESEPGFCTICDAMGIQHLNLDDEYTEEDFSEEELNSAAFNGGSEFHREWREDLEANSHVPRDVVTGYVNDVTEAAILNAATLARIGRKWGLEEE